MLKMSITRKIMAMSEGTQINLENKKSTPMFKIKLV